MAPVPLINTPKGTFERALPNHRTREGTFEMGPDSKRHLLRHLFYQKREDALLVKVAFLVFLIFFRFLGPILGGYVCVAVCVGVLEWCVIASCGWYGTGTMRFSVLCTRPCKSAPRSCSVVAETRRAYEGTILFLLPQEKVTYPSKCAQ